MKKVLFYIWISLVVFTSTQLKAQNPILKQYAESGNRQCPIETLGGMIRVLGFSYENNVFESSMEMNIGNLFDMTKVSNKPKEAKELMGIMLSNMHKSSAGALFDEMVKSKAIYKANLSSMYVPEKLTINYTSSELEKYFEKYDTMTASERILSMQVASINLQAPIVEDEYTTMDRLVLTESSLKYFVTIDDQMLGSSSLGKTELEDLKKGLKYSLSLSPVKDKVINACLNTFRTTVYTFTMKHSGNKYEIVLDSKDLRDILK